MVVVGAGALPTFSLMIVPGATSVPEVTLCVMTLPSFESPIGTAW